MPLQRTYLSYNKQFYTHYYLCHYLPASAGRDHLSHSLLKFKKERQPDLDAWTDCTLELFTQATIPPGATIIRALHHDETTISPATTALDHLGQKLAAAFHHLYHPHLLQKTHPTQPIKLFSRPRRQEELLGLYHIPHLPENTPDRWLIIDDILTSGATIRVIIQAIHEACLSPVHETRPSSIPSIDIFTLARATATLPIQPRPLRGRQYQFEDKDTDWTLTELPNPYYSLLQLKAMIQDDTF